MKKDKTVNLNTDEINRVIQRILRSKTGFAVPVKEIYFCNKENSLYIFGYKIPYNDLYLHYTDECDFPYIIFSYLKFVDHTLGGLFSFYPKDIEALKRILKEWENRQIELHESSSYLILDN